MINRKIILCYRKIISAGAARPWDQLVFDDSYLEFRMQAQNFTTGTPYTSYAELMRHIPAAAQLAARITPAISGYVQQLGNLMPDIISNTGRRFIRFDSFQLEIINSDINDKNKHQIGINFYSVPLLWVDTIDNYLLVAEPPQAQEADAPLLTHLFQLVPYLTIHSLSYV